MMKRRFLIRTVLLCCLSIAGSVAPVSASEKPNFLVILADDMAWSDIGSFGGEIRTPTLDTLAAEGVSMHRFYVGPTCSPTRAMLLSGVDSHLAGVGTMEGVQRPNQTGSRAYQAQLHSDVVTLAEGLKQAGYHTLMSGKWHIAKDAEQFPHKRGFDRSFVLAEGGASHFSDARPLYRNRSVTYLENGEPAQLPDDFYSTYYYTDKMLSYLQDAPDDQPFFAYLAYTAPHDPLQVPEDWQHRYRGQYEDGPDALRERRIARLRQLGLFPADAETWMAPKLPDFLPINVQRWSDKTAEERAQAARPMEIYASMVELMDGQIRRVVEALDQTGRLENTYIIFLSDNGANGATPLSYPNNNREWFENTYDHSAEAQGRRGSHTFLGMGWAWATAAPFKLYKGAVGDGGIRSPLIVRGPGLPAGSSSKQLAFITDLTATLYDLAGLTPTKHPAFNNKLLPEGLSLAEHWRQPGLQQPRTIALELFGSRAVISDRWKATNMGPPLSNGEWSLFDMQVDPGEVNDVADENPEQLAELLATYSRYQQRVGIILPEPPVTPSFGDLFTGECSRLCETTVSLVDSLIWVWQQFMPVED